MSPVFVFELNNGELAAVFLLNRLRGRYNLRPAKVHDSHELLPDLDNANVGIPETRVL